MITFVKITSFENSAKYCPKEPTFWQKTLLLSSRLTTLQNFEMSAKLSGAQNVLSASAANFSERTKALQ